MSLFNAILLGLIQGLTEFLPISSSGHLVLSEHLLHAKMPGVSFELMLHFGTLLSVLIYFHKDIINLIKAIFNSSMRDERRMIFFLIIGTIPAIIFALLLKGPIESAFNSPGLVSIFLMLTGLILLLTAIPRSRNKSVGLWGAIIIGCGQALAILPGVSRSGTSISAGLFFGVNPVKAAEFSFLLSIPAIAGAIVFKMNEISGIEPGMMLPYSLGTLISFLSGLLAVYILLKLIKKGKFMYFGIYCIALGLLGVIYFN